MGMGYRGYRPSISRWWGVRLAAHSQYPPSAAPTRPMLLEALVRAYNLIPSALSRRPHLYVSDRGVLSRVVTSVFRRHDAGWPK